MDEQRIEGLSSEWRARYERSGRMRRHARVHFVLSMLVVVLNLVSLVASRFWHMWAVLAALTAAIVVLVSAIRDMSGVLYGWRTEPRLPEMMGPIKASALQIAATAALVAFVAIATWNATR